MKILLVKNRAMGDAIMGLSAAQYLKQMIPGCEITYALPTWITQLFYKTNCSIDHLLALDFKGWKETSNTITSILNMKPDMVIELHQAGRTSKIFSLMPYPYYYNNHQKTERGPATQRDLDGVWRNIFPTSPQPHHLNFVPKIMTPKASEEYILLGVVASRWTKIWPLENYLQLMNQFPNQTFIIPLSNSIMDQQIESILRKALPSNARIIKSPLIDLPSLCASSKFYLGNDTGLKHLCVALGKKTFTFFGPEEPMEWHPYDQHHHPYFFIDKLECRTRTSHFCGLSQCDSMICLKDLSVNKIAERIQSYVS